jgi:hypothetical protein
VEAANELLSEREDNEAYLAADPGRACVLYFPADGQVTVDLTGFPEKLTAHWINIDTGQPGPPATVAGGQRVSLSPPDDRGNWAAAILAP